jgi:uncharacterized metal-binding protein YceD (DUF177 family)
MEFFQEMIIPFSGLKPGIHSFSFKVDGSFFRNFEYSEIMQADLIVDLVMERQPRLLVFEFDIRGTVTVPCDRCLEEYIQDISGRERLIVKFGEQHHEETEEILVITEQEHQVDLRQVIFEYIHLALPIRRVHGEDEQGNSLCDPGVTGFISNKPDICGEDKTDARWDALKRLKNKDSNTINT